MIYEPKMREIKFRGFSISAKRWIHGYVWIVPGVNLYYMLTGKIDVRDCSIEKYEVYPESIGQYTGIKDKNDNEIFEGDILEDDMGNIRTVIFRDSGFYGYQKNWDIYLVSILAPNCNVIGNIYENKDLLEG